MNANPASYFSFFTTSLDGIAPIRFEVEQRITNAFQSCVRDIIQGLRKLVEVNSRMRKHAVSATLCHLFFFLSSYFPNGLSLE